jgi:23S rRNA (pseudouridine1915-N3)-methyltransferase
VRILIASVGQTKGELASVEDDYLAMAAKLGRTIGLRGIDRPPIAQSKAGTPVQRMVEESLRIGEIVRGNEVWALDPGGSQITSEDLAATVRRALDGGVGSLAFVIGGPDGLAPAVKRDSAGLIAFGRLTWPHRLVRVMLAEQIYRAVTILVNHPYHRGG